MHNDTIAIESLSFSSTDPTVSYTNIHRNLSRCQNRTVCQKLESNHRLRVISSVRPSIPSFQLIELSLKDIDETRKQSLARMNERTANIYKRPIYINSQNKPSPQDEKKNPTHRNSCQDYKHISPSSTHPPPVDNAYMDYVRILFR